MKKRFFFDRVDVTGNKLSVNQSVENPSTVFPDTAYSATPLFYDTLMVAKTAFNLILFQLFI
jgi:hypothetical protein